MTGACRVYPSLPPPSAAANASCAARITASVALVCAVIIATHRRSSCTSAARKYPPPTSAVEDKISNPALRSSAIRRRSCLSGMPVIADSCRRLTAFSAPTGKRSYMLVFLCLAVLYFCLWDCWPAVSHPVACFAAPPAERAFSLLFIFAFTSRLSRYPCPKTICGNKCPSANTEGWKAFPMQ